MRPENWTRPEYVAAFRELVTRIAESLREVPSRLLPVQMFVAGGAALHFHTGERVSVDVDAVFSKRIALPEDLDVTYKDVDGGTRLLYFDRQYNDTLGLMHEDAQQDALPLELPGIDSRVLDVRILTPVDLAVTKVGRFTEQDRADVLALARRGRITGRELEARAMQALDSYVGDVQRVRGNVSKAVKLIAGKRPVNPG